MSIQGRRVAPSFNTEPERPHSRRSGRRGGGNGRHGCLTAWLVVLIIGVAYHCLDVVIFSVDPTNPYKLGFLGLLLLPLYAWYFACVIALFNWRRWGFWGIVAAQVVVTILLLLLGVHWALSLRGWIGVILLYAMLHIGGDRKAWPRLR